MSPSPVRPVRMVFVVGCPRSGTTWVQLLLAQHPTVTTTIETHVFPDYLSPMIRRYRREREAQRRVGLTPVLSEERFHALCRGFVAEIAAAAMKEKPGAHVFVEKTPNHGLHGDEILELFPDAHFVHVLRDPRAVAASLLVASRSWARGWAPDDPLEAARLWRNAVTRARSIGERTDRYVEVAYEDLQMEPEATLATLTAALGLEAEEGFCREAVAACRADREDDASVWAPSTMKRTVGRMARRARIDGWREELPRSSVEILDWELRDLLPAFGYVPERDPSHGPPRSVLRAKIRRRLAHHGGRIAALLRRLRRAERPAGA